jgi:hypothetical protein
MLNNPIVTERSGIEPTKNKNTGSSNTEYSPCTIYCVRLTYVVYNVTQAQSGQNALKLATKNNYTDMSYMFYTA